MIRARLAGSRGGLAALSVCLLLVATTEAVAQAVPRSLQVNGRTRTYNLHVPPSYTGKSPVPLVLVLHGWGGSGRGIETGSQFTAKANQEGFIVAYPNALGFPSTWSYGWGASNRDPAEDVAFFTQLLDSLEAEFVLDSRRVFIAGISDGGSMAHYLAAVLPQRVSAVAVVAGAVGSYKHGDLLQAPPPAQPVPVVIIHGLRDRIVPFDGGPWGTLLIPMVSVPHSTLFWILANSCDPDPAVEINPDGTVLTATFAGDAAVRLHVILDGAHEWFRRPTFDATDAIWDFFATVTRP